MNCLEARAALLEADLEELRGTADTSLALHLRDCADCRAGAERILRVEDALGRRLAALAPRRSIARAPATPRRRRPWRWAVPLAAAAGIVALVVTRPPEPRPEDHRPPDLATHEVGGVSVRAPAGRNVAVFQTDNPDIVVIWFY